MKGHIRRKVVAGKVRYYVEIERGIRDAQRCLSCHRRYWLEGSRLNTCPKCGGGLEDVKARRQDQIPGGFKLKGEAESALRDALVRLESGRYTAASKVTLEQFLTDWLKSAEHRVASATFALYKDHERVYIRPALGRVRLTDLSIKQIEAFYSKLRTAGGKKGTGLAPKTIGHTRSLLRAALNDAIREGLLSMNPAALAKAPKIERPKMKTWGPDEVRIFLEAAATDRNYAAYLLEVTTGLRRSEVLGARRSALDLDAATLSIVSTSVLVENKARLQDSTKTPGSRRSVPLAPATVSALRAHLKRQAEERLALGVNYSDADLLFATPVGGLINLDTYSRTFKRIARVAGLPPITLRDLRHTFASIALRSDVHAKVVQEILGHSSIRQTMDTYSAVIPAMKEGATSRVADAIFSPDKP